MRHRLATVIVATASMLAPAAIAAAAPAAGSPLVWGDCPPAAAGSVRDPRQQCASLRVPLDYRDPRGRTIEIAISRIAATKAGVRRGVLLSNPGGPGEPGLDLPSMLAQAMPNEVLDRFDLIGLDPRGIGHSTPVTCAMRTDQPDLLFPWPGPDGNIERNVAYAKSVARSCAEHSGDLLPYITTANTARDMDRVRDALGEARISFYGRSYGTYLGAVYDSLFPGRADRMVLDSGIDPRLVWYRQWRLFAPAVALRFPDFTGWAAARDDLYHLGATPDAVRRRYFALAAALDAHPLPSPVPEVPVLTGTVFREYTRQLLYFDELFPDMVQLWQYAESAAGTPAPALRQAAPTPNAATGVPADNPPAGLIAVLCGDVAWPSNVGLYRHNVATDRRVFPITDGMPANVWPCAFWQFRPVEPPVRVTDHGPRNILILQNLRDPATPWITGFGLRTVLGRRAVMVSVDAGGHTAYGRGACATSAADSFLITGHLPPTDQFCDGAPRSR